MTKQDHSVNWGINPPQKKQPAPFLPSPPLNRQTVQAPFLGNPSSLLVFREPPPPPPLKVRFFSETSKY